MSIFSKQWVFCRECGVQFETDFKVYKGEVCSTECFYQLRWKKDLSILNAPFKPMPKIDKYGLYIKEEVNNIGKT